MSTRLRQDMHFIGPLTRDHVREACFIAFRQGTDIQLIDGPLVTPDSGFDQVWMDWERRSLFADTPTFDTPAESLPEPIVEFFVIEHPGPVYSIQTRKRGAGAPLVGTGSGNDELAYPLVIRAQAELICRAANMAALMQRQATAVPFPWQKLLEASNPSPDQS